MKLRKWIKGMVLMAAAGVPLITSVTCDPYYGFDFYRDDDFDDYYYDDGYYVDYYYEDCYWFCF